MPPRYSKAVSHAEGSMDYSEPDACVVHLAVSQGCKRNIGTSQIDSTNSGLAMDAIDEMDRIDEQHQRELVACNPTILILNC